MPLYEYIAADAEGKIKSAQMEAVDRLTVISYLKDQDLLVVSVKEKKQELGQILAGKVTMLDKISLTSNLAIMIKAGVSMSEALDVIARDSKNTYFQKVCADLRFDLENGRPLSDGLSHYPKDFDHVFISLIKAGEASGKVEQVLKQLSLQLKKEYSLTSKVKNAFAYPVVLVGGLIGVVILLVTFVLPKLVALFETSNLRLPLGTRIVFAVSKAFSYNPYISLSVVVVLAIGLVFLLRQKKVRAYLMRLLFKIPLSANLLRQIELTRFTRTLGNLLQSGVPIVQALEITAEGMALPSYRKMTLRAKDEIAKGVSLANAFKKNSRIFPEMIVSVMQVGEKSGDLAELLFGLGDFFEEQVDNTLNNLAGLVEPVLLIIVGLAIGGMAISIILPIYQLIGSF